MMTPDAFRSLIEVRQSLRFFEKDRTIPLETLEAILDDAQQAPNDCNHQSWKFVVITDQLLKERLVNTAGSCEPARRASVLIVPLIESGWNHNKFSVIQTLAAATHTITLSASARGIASVWMAGIGNIDAIRSLLNIPACYIIDCFVGLGYAEARKLPWPKPPRQHVKKIYSINGFRFDADTTYPLKKAKRYDFWKIRNQRNPYALWNPRDWTLRQIAFFRGNAVWANSPSPTLHKSRRFASEFASEIELASKHARPGKTLVMLPYSGAYSAALLKKHSDLELTHFELSPNHEPIIRKRLREEGIETNVPFLCDDGLRVPAPDGAFQNVLLFQALESVPDPKLLLDEATRVLQTGGRLIVSCRNKWSWFYLQYVRSIRRETVWNFGPYVPRAPSLLRSCLGRGVRGTMFGISPTPKRIGIVARAWPFNHFSRLFFFVGEKTHLS